MGLHAKVYRRVRRLSIVKKEAEERGDRKRWTSLPFFFNITASQYQCEVQ